MAESMGLHGMGGDFGHMLARIIIVAIGDFADWRYPLIFFGLATVVCPPFTACFSSCLSV